MDLVFAPSQIETWSIDRLRPYARNAKIHGTDQVAKIAASMAKFGWTVPCMVADDGELIAGHEFAKLDQMEAENREKLERYEKSGWVADPTKVPIGQTSLFTVTYNLKWVADKRAAFERQRGNPQFVDDMKRHFDILREGAHWAADLAPRIEELVLRLKKGNMDQILAEDDADAFRDLLFRQSFASRRISWVVETIDEVVTPLGGAPDASLVLREELTDRYLRDRDSLKAFPKDLENLEQYFRHVTDVHSSGASLHKGNDDIVLLELASDQPMQWAFPGKLVFAISPNDLRIMKLSEAKMYFVE